MSADEFRGWEPPTVEECHAFLAKVNEGRAAFGLEPLTEVPLAASEPGQSCGCLSYRALIEPIRDTIPPREGWKGGAVGCLAFTAPNGEAGAKLAAALGVDQDPMMGSAFVKIPDEILAVTDPFDALVELSDVEAEAFRERLIEAGIAS